MNQASIEQYQAEERTLIAYRLAASRYRVMDLLNIMSKDQISTPEKVAQLSGELGEFFNSRQIRRCKTMGEIVKQTMRHILKPYMARIQRNIGKIVDE